MKMPLWRLSGCYAQTAPKELMEIAGVNLVIGTKDRAQIVEMVEQYDRANGVENHVSDIMKERVFEPGFPFKSWQTEQEPI